MSKKLISLLSTSLLLIGLTACNNQQPTPTPSSTPASAESSTPAPAPADKNDTNKTTVYMVKMEDDGKTAGSIKVGCGDSAVPVTTTVGYQYDKTDAVASINAAIMTLISTTTDQFKSQNLENTLASTNSALTIQSVDKPITKNAPYIVHLNGKFSFGGVCDTPRVKAQVEETIKKAALGNATAIDFNGGGQAAWDKAFSSK